MYCYNKYTYECAFVVNILFIECITNINVYIYNLKSVRLLSDVKLIL